MNVEEEYYSRSCQSWVLAKSLYFVLCRKIQCPMVWGPCLSSTLLQWESTCSPSCLLEHRVSITLSAFCMPINTLSRCPDSARHSAYCKAMFNQCALENSVEHSWHGHVVPVFMTSVSVFSFSIIEEKKKKNSGIKNPCPSKRTVSHSRESAMFLSAVNCWALNTFAFWIWNHIKWATFAPFCFLLPTGLNNSRSQLAWAVKWRLQARVWRNMHPRSVYTYALPGGCALCRHSKV